MFGGDLSGPVTEPPRWISQDGLESTSHRWQWRWLGAGTEGGSGRCHIRQPSSIDLQVDLFPGVCRTPSWRWTLPSDAVLSLVVELTESWRNVMPDPIIARYDFLETRDAAAVLQSTSPGQFQDVCAVLSDFSLTTEAILSAGGNETLTAGRLNAGFHDRGWREERAVSKITTFMQERGTTRNASDGAIRAETTAENEGYYIDNVKGKVVLDVEWNAKDGNLDRDLGMYRWLYDVGFVSVAVMITRDHYELREFGRALRTEAGQTPAEVNAWLGTTTTTNATKLIERLKSGNTGGCPFLGVAITKRTWDGTPVSAARHAAPEEADDSSR